MSSTLENAASTGGTRRKIQSVDRALGILGVIASRGGAATLQEVADESRFHKSTAYRLLTSLEERGMVDRDLSTGRYQLGLELIALAGTVLGKLEVTRIADPHLRRLADETQETANLAVRHRHHILNVEQIPGPRLARSVDWIGKRSPLHKGAAAKALLAHLGDDDISAYLAESTDISTAFNKEALWNEISAIRNRGAAINHGELDPNVFAVGAPVFNMAGQPCASISVAGIREDFSDARTSELVDHVIEVAVTISRQMGYQGGRVAEIA